MYESPITQIITDISSQVRELQDGRLMYEVQQAIGYEIDKGELIKALNYDRNQYQKGYEDGRKDNEWIPVSERLPDDFMTCYVTVEEDDRYGEPQRVIYPEFVGYDGETWVNRAGEVIPFEVIAWKELSEPYKGVSE